MLYVKLGKNRLHGFRGDVWKCWRTDGRMMDACLYYKLTYEPLAQVSWICMQIQRNILMYIASARVLAVRKTNLINWTNPKMEKNSFLNFFTVCFLRCQLWMLDTCEFGAHTFSHYQRNIIWQFLLYLFTTVKLIFEFVTLLPDLRLASSPSLTFWQLCQAANLFLQATVGGGLYI